MEGVPTVVAAVALLLTSGVTVLITKAWDQVAAAVQGRAKERKTEVNRALGKARKLERKLHVSQTNERKLTEALSLARRLLYQYDCVPVEVVPEFPELSVYWESHSDPETGPNQTLKE